MDQKGLCPDKLEILPEEEDASKYYKRWNFVFRQYISTFKKNQSESYYLAILANCLSIENYELISECEEFEEAMTKLKDAFNKQIREHVSRFKLMNRKQQIGESIDGYVRNLQKLSLNCNFKNVTSKEYKDEYIRDSFIAGLSSSYIRSKLLESDTLTLDSALKQARALELAAKDSSIYDNKNEEIEIQVSAMKDINDKRICQEEPTKEASSESLSIASTKTWKFCYRCGDKSQHSKSECKARNIICFKCKNKGHFAKYCRLKKNNAALVQPVMLASVKETKVDKNIVNVRLFNKTVKGLIDSGSAENFIDKSIVNALNIPTRKFNQTFRMALSGANSTINECCILDICIYGRRYQKERFLVGKNVSHYIILGEPFLKKHKSVSIDYGGPEKPLKICSLSSMKIEQPRLLKHLSEKCSSIAVKSDSTDVSSREFCKASVENELVKIHDGLDSIRSLLCTSINCAPQERLFDCQRKSSYGVGVPGWLMNHERVLVRRFIKNKSEPLVEEVDLLGSNQSCAHVRFSNGREDIVTISDLAPLYENDCSTHQMGRESLYPKYSSIDLKF